MTMVRKHLHTPDLKLKRFDVGSRGKNAVAVMHIAGVTNPALVEEVYRRIEKIEVDAILSGGIMEQFIEDDWLSIFPQMATTERPDAVVTALLQGRVAIFTGNTPLVLVVPTTLDHLMHSPEDLYQRWQVASSVRVLRAVAVFLSLTLPSFYIALTSYHAEMILTTLALAIGASRQAVPFPAFWRLLSWKARWSCCEKRESVCRHRSGRPSVSSAVLWSVKPPCGPISSAPQWSSSSL